MILCRTEKELHVWAEDEKAESWIREPQGTWSFLNKRSAAVCQVPFPQHPEQVWRGYNDMYYWLVCSHYWTRYKVFVIWIVAREYHRPWRRNHLICLHFSFCSSRIFFELLRSSNGYSKRWIRAEILYGDNNGGSSMHHVCQGADYIQKTQSPSLSFFLLISY